MKSRSQVFRSLAIMQKAGLPLCASLDSLAIQFAGGPEREALEKMAMALRCGRGLRQSAGQATPLFDSYHQALLGVAEQTGDLAACLESLAVREESRQALRQRISAQLVYPVLVFSSMLLLAVVGLPILRSAVPNSGLPSPQALVMFLGLAALSLRSVRLRKLLYNLKPLRELRHKLATAHFLASWSGMLEQGIPLLLSLELAAHASQDPKCASALLAIAQSLRSGASLEQAFVRSPYFSPLVKGCVLGGMECGALPRFTRHLAELYELEVASAVESLVCLLAPFCLMFMGAALLLALLTTVQPLLNLAAQL